MQGSAVGAEEATGAAPTARDRRHAQTLTDIVDAAWVLCREHGLAGLSLRELATSVGLRAPSLYSYVDGKDAIYDRMFRQGYEQLHEAFADWDDDLSAEPEPRARIKDGARRFFDFCVEDPVRSQLLFQRTIPGFEPTPDTYAVAVEALSLVATQLASLGLDGPGVLDLWTALLTGLTDQQISNDPGGDRWSRLLDDAVDMFCDHHGIPARGRRTNRKDRR